MRTSTPKIEIGHYRKSRYWGVWIDSELLAVVCYRKGAEAVKLALLSQNRSRKKAGPQEQPHIPQNIDI